MKFHAQPIEGCHVVMLEPLSDDRGFFARAFSVDELNDVGLESHISQMNLSRSEAAGTIRGIHWQEPPFEEAKFVRCIRGRIFDVCVDLRPESITWGQWVGVELTAKNRLAMYIPPGCGHAYQTLDPETEVLYSTSAPYMPDLERGARWDDPALDIDWPLRDNVILSPKDQAWSLLQRP